MHGPKTPLLAIHVLMAVLVAQARGDTITVFYALDADLKALRGDAVSNTFSLLGTSWQSFELGGHRVIATQMGAGSVETAISTAAVLAKVSSDLVVSIGPAGCLDGSLEEGETFFVGEVVGFQRGSWKSGVWGLAAEATGECADFPAIAPSLPRRRMRLASGEAFVASDSARERIREETQASAIDMNSFGLLSACSRFQLKPVILRVVSDQADNVATEAFRDFASTYNGELGSALREAILLLKPSPENPDAHPAIRRLLEDGSGASPSGP